MWLYAPLSSDIDRSLNVISTRLASVTVGRVSKSTYEHLSISISDHETDECHVMSFQPITITKIVVLLNIKFY